MATICVETSDIGQPKQVGYGLPCAKCRVYYAADLASCPICGCPVRAPANPEDLRRLRIIATQ